MTSFVYLFINFPTSWNNKTVESISNFPLLEFFNISKII